MIIFTFLTITLAIFSGLEYNKQDNKYIVKGEQYESFRQSVCKGLYQAGR